MFSHELNNRDIFKMNDNFRAANLHRAFTGGSSITDNRLAWSLRWEDHMKKLEAIRDASITALA